MSGVIVSKAYETNMLMDADGTKVTEESVGIQQAHTFGIIDLVKTLETLCHPFSDHFYPYRRLDRGCRACGDGDKQGCHFGKAANL